jgi:hypothetical protein
MIYASAALAFLASQVAFAAVTPAGKMGSVTKQETVRRLDSGSELVALYSEPAYVNPIYLLSLHGSSSYDQGHDAGLLFGNQISENYQSLFLSLFGDIRIEPALQELTEMFLDWQWDAYLSKDVPQEYLDEVGRSQLS